ncbi:MAG: serine hydrolase domain-containing protein, partial [Hyphomicrobiales bacterium]
KGFLILKDNVILGEYYDNFLNIGTLQLLQSSSKTYAGIIVSKLIDKGLIDTGSNIDSYLADFRGSAIGAATVQHVLDMQAGLLPANDYHVPGGEAYVFETEQGLKPGEPTGHRKAVIAAERPDKPGEVYNYNDKNTDLLAMLAEGVTGQPFNRLLSDLFDDFGATSRGSIALTVDGTASPSYGVSTTLRDYGLFHQWIAQGKAPDSFYASVADIDKDLYNKSKGGLGTAELLGTKVTYANQAWVMPEHDIIYSLGSYGQVGFSHLPSGTTIIFMQDWEDNGVASKYKETVDRAMFILDQINSQ